MTKGKYRLYYCSPQMIHYPILSSIGPSITISMGQWACNIKIWLKVIEAYIQYWLWTWAPISVNGYENYLETHTQIRVFSKGSSLTWLETFASSQFANSVRVSCSDGDKIKTTGHFSTIFRPVVAVYTLLVHTKFQRASFIPNTLIVV